MEKKSESTCDRITPYKKKVKKAREPIKKIKI